MCFDCTGSCKVCVRVLGLNLGSGIFPVNFRKHDSSAAPCERLKCISSAQARAKYVRALGSIWAAAFFLKVSAYNGSSDVSCEMFTCVSRKMYVRVLCFGLRHFSCKFPSKVDLLMSLVKC